MDTADGSNGPSEYRPVSVLAVAGLVAGCSSSLVLLTPLAAVVPIVAIALAFGALSGIRRSEGRTVGRWLALAGLALAVGFAAQAAGSAITTNVIARQRAAATVEAWIEAIRSDRLADAIAVSGPLALPAAATNHRDPPPSPEAQLKAFRELPAVQAVAACGTTKPAITSIDRRDGGWVVRIPLADRGSARTITLSVEARLVTRRGQALEEWLVNDFRLDP